MAWIRARASTLAIVALLAGACRQGDGSRPLVVFAASSLTETLQELEPVFEAEHPGVDVQLAFAGTQALRVQIEQGARADVFASAAPRHMQALVDAELVVRPRLLAHNALVVVVPLHGSPVDSLEELPEAERIVLGAPEVPVGMYARQLIERADEAYGGAFAQAVDRRVVSHEANVRLVLAKVELGEADAAIVYRTDAIASGKVRAIAVPASLATPTEYTVGIVARSPEREAATAWIELLESARGHESLARHGFAIPGTP